MITFATSEASMTRGSDHLSGEHASGESAPAAGTYEQINIFGHPNGIRVDMNHGHPFPQAPIGHFWRAVKGGRGER
jgi:hypothetical protein